MLREPRTLDTLTAALEDPAPLVRAEAVSALEMLCEAAAECRPAALSALRRLVVQESDPNVLSSGRAAIVELERTT